MRVDRYDQHTAFLTPFVVNAGDDWPPFLFAMHILHPRTYFALETLTKGQPAVLPRLLFGPNISAPKISTPCRLDLESIKHNCNRSLQYNTDFIVMTVVPWTIAYKSWSIRLQPTNLIACVNIAKGSHTQAAPQTRSRRFHGSVPRRQILEITSEEEANSFPSKPKMENRDPRRNDEKPAGTPARPSPSAR